MSRYLGIDYGTKRVGLAISDDLGLTARPLDVVLLTDLDDALLRIVDEYQVEGVVLGLPTSLGGYEGDSAAGARELGQHIGNLLNVPVEYMDERFTSRMAESALLESGMKRRERRETVDKVAAAIILQAYLDGRRSPGNHPGGTGVEPPETT
ncbi:MAG TPA: Holliday junction resolvase RuvX [Acidimicrobiia bacterium]|nr:Holliday junction resolvase RuvX [Acidimicrobiia bacterium]